MSDTTSERDHSHHAHVVVHPVVDATPLYRCVDILGTHVGKAHSLRDVAEFCRRAGLADLDLEAPGSVQWIGGGWDAWEA